MNLALDRIKKMKAYNPPVKGRADFDGLLLDFNERYAAPEFLKKSLSLAKGRINLYPEYFDLENLISQYAGVDPKNIMVCAGSDQAIDLALRTFSEKGDEVIIPSPTFSMFYQVAEALGSKIVTPRYTKDLAFPAVDVLDSINSRTKVVLVCNPNNPTGSLASLADIEKIVRKAKNSIVLVDEAYFEFSGVSAVLLLKKCQNILITRTFSKAFGLAGLRVGYVIGTAENLQQLRKIRGPYAVDAVGYAAAKQALIDKSEMQDYAEEVVKKARPHLEDFLKRHNIKFYKSAANFILIDPEKAAQVYEVLKRNGVLVRPQNRQGIEGTIRVTVTTLSQIKQFCDIYNKSILKNERAKQ